MLASVRAELLKLRKRPAIWVLLVVLVASNVVFGYLVTYAFATSGEMPGVDPAELVATLLPDQFVVNTLSGFAGFGGPITLILAGLAVGSEYGWNTVKTIATQRPGRTALLAGKLVAVAMAVLCFAAATLAATALASVGVAAAEGEAVTFPGLGTIVGGLAAAWLMLGVWAGLGALLALVFRGTGLALGIGLAYALALESVLLALPLGSGWSEATGQALLSANSSALAGAFGSLPEGFGGPGGMPTAASPEQAAVVLAVYLAAFVLGGWALFARRPIP